MFLLFFLLNSIHVFSSITQEFFFSEKEILLLSDENEKIILQKNFPKSLKLNQFYYENINQKNIQNMVFEEFQKINIKQKNLNISYYTENEISWLYFIEKIMFFENLSFVILKQYASFALEKIDFSEHDITQLIVFCDKKEHVNWVDETDPIVFKTIEQLNLDFFASKLIKKIANQHEIITVLEIDCKSIEQIEWIFSLKNEEIILGRIKNIFLNKHASQIITKLFFTKNKTEKVFIFCEEKSQFEWIQTIDQEVFRKNLEDSPIKKILQEKQNLGKNLNEINFEWTSRKNT